MDKKADPRRERGHTTVNNLRTYARHGTYTHTTHARTTEGAKRMHDDGADREQTETERVARESVRRGLTCCRTISGNARAHRTHRLSHLAENGWKRGRRESERARIRRVSSKISGGVEETSERKRREIRRGFTAPLFRVEGAAKYLLSRGWPISRLGFVRSTTRSRVLRGW